MPLLGTTALLLASTPVDSDPRKHLTRARNSVDSRLLLCALVRCHNLPFPSLIPQNRVHRKPDAAAQLAVAGRLGTCIVSAPRDAEEVCRALCRAYDHERFGILFLDSRHQVLHAETLFRGTIDGATVYPREVVKRSLELGAAAVILTHNHPSGVAKPSESDRAITIKLAKALITVEIRLLDHVVLARVAPVGAGDTTLMNVFGNWQHPIKSGMRT